MTPSAPIRRLLSPLFPLYRLALAVRDLRLQFGLEPVQWLRFPVVSIGNLSTGGSGKTPLTIALAKALAHRGLRVDVLSRGYGRRSRLATRVHPRGTAVEFGDEPLLIAREAGVPVFVAPRRYDAGQLAEAEAEAQAKAAEEAKEKDEAEAETGQSAAAEEPAPPNWPVPEFPVPELPVPELAAPSETSETCLLQAAQAAQAAPELNLSPALSTSEAASDPETPPEGKSPAEEADAEDPQEKVPPPLHVHLLDDGFQHRRLGRAVDILLLNQHDWKGWLLPAGNLREPIGAARRASVLAIPANEPELEAALYVWGWQGPVWRLHRKMDIPLAASPIAAFCGIAHPKQFFAGLEATGLKVALRRAFPDHFTYTRDVLEELLAEARAQEVTAILTTRKDLARLGKLATIFPPSLPLVAVQLRVEIEDEDAAVSWLISRIKSAL